jgi:hypothetical protein
MVVTHGLDMLWCYISDRVKSGSLHGLVERGGSRCSCAAVACCHVDACPKRLLQGGRIEVIVVLTSKGSSFLGRHSC